jgi:hypothetical protein
MTTLTVDKLEPNMIVAEPVVTKRGQTIIRAGEKLTPQMIAKLTFYKIESATVEDVEEEAPVEVAPEPEPEPENPKAAPKEKKRHPAYLNQKKQ